MFMPLDQVTYGQNKDWLYSTLVEYIFLNEKHAIFLKIFNFGTLYQIFFKYPNPRNLLEPCHVRVEPKCNSSH